jgi:hypothetical protein
MVRFVLKQAFLPVKYALRRETGCMGEQPGCMGEQTALPATSHLIKIFVCLAKNQKQF